LSDLKLPEGVAITQIAHGGDDLAVATITIVREEVVETPVVEAAVAAPGEAAAPGAAPAAPGAAPGVAAAPAAAADAKKPEAGKKPDAAKKPEGKKEGK
jgi:hypothetical protein